ncbi:hypothetical protein [Serinicoccus hydrothermalis]|uniref:hypothetical protein n=1 Tax=Serinicoccus hydrothermalis TaxID=1758689 RepID=UPI00082AB68B|nr:hypothetical protein [Serinicoccus hydrothermalis]
MIQQVDGSDVEGAPVHWTITGASALIDDDVRPALFGDLFITDETGWQVGTSAVAVLTEPGPKDGHAFSADELRQIEADWTPQLEHLLYDVAATQARTQCATVDASMDVPRKTPGQTKPNDEASLPS